MEILTSTKINSNVKTAIYFFVTFFVFVYFQFWEHLMNLMEKFKSADYLRNSRGIIDSPYSPRGFFVGYYGIFFFYLFPPETPI